MMFLPRKRKVWSFFLLIVLLSWLGAQEKPASHSAAGKSSQDKSKASKEPKQRTRDEKSSSKPARPAELPRPARTHTGTPRPIPFGPGMPAPGVTQPQPAAASGAAGPATSAAPAPGTKPAARGGQQGFNLQIYDADLFEFIDMIAKQLDMDYLIDPNVTAAKVNISIKKPVPKEALMPILIDILRINGTTIVKSGDIFHFVPILEGKKYPSAIRMISSKAEVAGEELNTYIIPVQYMPSGELARILDEFKTDNTQIINLADFNVLMISDFGDNLKKLFDIIETLDDGFFEVNHLELVPVVFNKAEDVAKDLGIVFSGGGTTSNGVRFVALPRLNSVLVVCRSEKSMEEVKKWVEKLDAPAARGVDTFVYKVENTTASNIASVLAQLFSDTGAQVYGNSGGAGANRGGRAVPTGENVNASGQGSVPMGGQVIQPELKGTTKSGEIGAIQGLSGNVKIITDDLNNSLIIQGTQADYEFLMKTIRKLDILPRQVLVEAKIVSVDLNGNLSWGVSAYLKGRTDTTPPTTGSYNDKSTGALSLSTLFTFGLNGRREVDILLSTLQSLTKTTVLDSPAILVLDGNQATFNVGTEIPIATSTFSNPYLNSSSTTTGTDYNVTNTTIQYRSTGVSLNVAPRISATGMVTLEIATEVSNAGEAAKGLAGSPPINRSALNTTMVVKDGASVVLAGIIRERNGSSVAGLPGIAKIPILGWLFGSSSKSTSRSEILIILTPHVVYDAEDLQKTSDVVQKSLKNINNYIRKKTKRKEFGVYQTPVPKKPKKTKHEKADLEYPASPPEPLPPAEPAAAPTGQEPPLEPEGAAPAAPAGSEKPPAPTAPAPTAPATATAAPTATAPPSAPTTAPAAQPAKPPKK